VGVVVLTAPIAISEVMLWFWLGATMPVLA
jgi:hypothetical protein